MNTQTKNRIKLIFITILFALPVMTAWLVYKNPQMLEGGKTKNHGQLISPAKPSNLADFITNGSDMDFSHLKGRWIMLHIDLDGHCNVDCEKSVHTLRQLNVLLNKDSHRLKRIYLDKTNETAIKTLLEDNELNIFQWNNEQIRTLRKLYDDFVDGDILLLDPLGNIMMKYHHDADPYGIQKDLKLLFKTSQIG